METWSVDKQMARFGWTLFRGLCMVAMLGAALAARAADTVRIVTEEFPPYNLTQNGRITGLSTEVVEAVLKEIKLEGNFQSMPWARAYDIALGSENVLIYSITRTPNREKLFKWVGVIAPGDWYLYALPGRRLAVQDLDEAKKYQIATVNQDAGEQFLVSKGFVIGQNLQSSVKYEFNYEKLKLGRVDLWVSNGLVAAFLARQAGDDPAKALAPAYHFSDLGSDGFYMAFGPKTSDAFVERFRKGLETIKKNGSFEALKRKWL
jgi:polar amino acid transport system substrate-binding protein